MVKWNLLKYNEKQYFYFNDLTVNPLVKIDIYHLATERSNFDTVEGVPFVRLLGHHIIYQAPPPITHRTIQLSTSTQRLISSR